MGHPLVTVTPALVHFIKLLQAARDFGWQEELLATSLGEPAPTDYMERCLSLLQTTYRRQCELVGLTADAETLTAILENDVPALLDEYPQVQWPELFAFDVQRGGIDYRSELSLRRQAG